MAIKLRPDLEERLKFVLKHKIIRIREAFNPNDPEEEDDELTADDPAASADAQPPANVPPVNAPKNAPANVPPVNAPKNTPANVPPANAPANVPPVNAPKNAPVNAPVNGAPMPKTAPANAPVNGVPAPANAPKNLPVSAPTNAPAVPDDVTNPAIDSPDAEAGQQSKIRQTKVKLFFDKLQANPTVMNYLNFSNPLEQAEAIIQFAELVQVPRTQLLPLLQQIRTLSQAPPANRKPVGESAKRRVREGMFDDGEEFGRPLQSSNTSVTPEALKPMSLNSIARLIYKDWAKVNYGAKPYLEAMSSLDQITDNYYEDSGRSIVAYFLANATSWKGPVAKAVKAELNRRLKSK